MRKGPGGLDKKKANESKEDFKEVKAELDSTIREMQQIINLLIPSLSMFDFTKATSPGVSRFNPQLHGFVGNESQEIEISISKSPPKVRKSADNDSLFENAQSRLKQIRKVLLPGFARWSKIFSVAEGFDSELKHVMDYKLKLQQLVEQFESIGVTYEDTEDNECEDMDLEDVPQLQDKPGYEATIPAHLRADYGLPSAESENPIPRINSRGIPVKPVTRTAKNKPKTVPFGLDLKYWGAEKDLKPAETVPKETFWSMEADDRDSFNLNELTANLRVREMPFVGEWEDVTKTCRAPMQNGELCGRMDRKKCPFHGTILPRDEEGNLVSGIKRKADDEPLYKSSRAKNDPMQDESLMRDIEAAKGVSLGRKTRKRKVSSLTDIKKSGDAVRGGLEKKLFNRRTVRRVGSALDSERKKKADEKHSHQFNYVHGTNYGQKF